MKSTKNALLVFFGAMFVCTSIMSAEAGVVGLSEVVANFVGANGSGHFTRTSDMGLRIGALIPGIVDRANRLADRPCQWVWLGKMVIFSNPCPAVLQLLSNKQMRVKWFVCKLMNPGRMDRDLLDDDLHQLLLEYFVFEERMLDPLIIARANRLSNRPCQWVRLGELVVFNNPCSYVHKMLHNEQARFEWYMNKLVELGEKAERLPDAELHEALLECLGFAERMSEPIGVSYGDGTIAVIGVRSPETRS